MKVEGKEAEQTLRLISALEDHDDVQNVFTNAEIDEKIMASFSG
jgi:transcriptional/translational regulatory protein YebC/TACO1